MFHTVEKQNKPKQVKNQQKMDRQLGVEISLPGCDDCRTMCCNKHNTCLIRTWIADGLAALFLYFLCSIFCDSNQLNILLNTIYC